MAEIEETCKLDFPSLEKQLETHFPDEPIITDRSEANAIALAALGFAISLVSTRFLPSRIALVVTVFGLLLEAAACIWIVFMTIKTNIPQFSRRSFMEEIEKDYFAHQQLVAWLKFFSPEELNLRLAYVKLRRDSLTQRLGLLIGSIERLGVLPILIALYIQFKDFSLKHPPDIGLIGGLIAFAMILLYGVGWWGISMKLRLGLYEKLLQQAVSETATSK